MATKKRQDEDTNSNVLGKMSGEQYWKWRLTIEELDHERTKSNLKHSECKIKMLEVEKANLQLLHLRRDYVDSVGSIQKAKEEYDKVKKEIEFELGFSMTDCVIDPYSFEIKKLEEDRQT